MLSWFVLFVILYLLHNLLSFITIPFLTELKILICVTDSFVLLQRLPAKTPYKVYVLPSKTAEIEKCSEKKEPLKSTMHTFLSLHQIYQNDY